MSLSYGATISTVPSSGSAAWRGGFSLLWLTFCKIFIGIFIAFIVLGEPTRRIGHGWTRTRL